MAQLLCVCVSVFTGFHLGKYSRGVELRFYENKEGPWGCRCVLGIPLKGMLPRICSLTCILSAKVYAQQYTKYYAHCKFIWSFPSNTSLNLKGGRILPRRGEGPPAPLNETLVYVYVWVRY